MAAFPTSGMHWCMYIEHELRSRCGNSPLSTVWCSFHRPSSSLKWSPASGTAEAEALFARALPLCPQLPLWEAYVDFLRAHRAADRDAVLRAYEELFRTVGLDPASQPVWTAYIAFVRVRVCACVVAVCCASWFTRVGYI